MSDGNLYHITEPLKNTLSAVVLLINIKLCVSSIEKLISGVLCQSCLFLAAEST